MEPRFRRISRFALVLGLFASCTRTSPQEPPYSVYVNADAECDPNDICNADPGFANLAAWDFHLGAGSPAAGTGINLHGPDYPQLDTDVGGSTRPSTGAWDMGAYVH